MTDALPGDNVIAACRNPENATELSILSRELSNPMQSLKNATTDSKVGSLRIVAMDVTDQRSIKQAALEISSSFQSLDLLINNAGITNPTHPQDVPGNVDPEVMVEIFRTNCVGPMLVTQEYMPLLLRASKPKVVNISSSLGSMALNERGGCTSYRTSKAALNMLTQTFAIEFQARCVFLAMDPGWVQTDMGSAGGRNPPLTVESSVHAMLQVMDTCATSGTFVNNRNQILPW